MVINRRLLLRVVLCILYVPFGAEIAVRIIGPVPILPRYVCATSYGIRGNEANKAYWHKTPEYRIKIVTNSKGIRSNKEIPYVKAAGTKRIVLLGDSFGMGYGVRDENMFTARMLDYLEDVYKYPIEVINLATSGHGNAEELVVLREEGIKYDPDIVLLAWHATDLLDNVRSGLYVLRNGQLEQGRSTYLPAIAATRILFRIPVYRFLVEHSQFYHFFRDWASRKVKSFLVIIRSAHERDDIQPSRVNANADYREHLAIALLDEMQQMCEEQGRHFVIFDIPVRRSRLEFDTHFPSEFINEQSPLRVISPIDQFYRNGNGKKLYWEKSHGHFTPLGCDLVGRALSEYIELNGLL
jgi:hypothetical protein